VDSGSLVRGRLWWFVAAQDAFGVHDIAVRLPDQDAAGLEIAAGAMEQAVAFNSEFAGAL
jgi:hypothetical protein